MKDTLINCDCVSELNFNEDSIKVHVYEKEYAEDMIKKVEPYIKQKQQKGNILGKNDVSLYYEKFIVDNPRGNIVISHGFGEFIDKYYELIYYFMQENYSVFIIEHRGNSRSGRLGKDDSQISVEKFDYYIYDFKKFLDEVVIPNSNNKELLLFGHSMGGGIGTLFIEEFPEYFKGAVLSSPMHEINTGKTSKFSAFMLSLLMNIFGIGKEYLPGQHAYTGRRVFPSRSTSSENRYNYQYKKIQDNKLFQTGGASAKWYLEAMLATKKIIKVKEASKVKIPVLLIQAEKDTHVMPRAHYKFARHAESCKILYVKKAKHEAYFECDEIAFPTIASIILFFNKLIDNNY